MSSFFSRTLLTFGLLGLLSGCASPPSGQSYTKIAPEKTETLKTETLRTPVVPPQPSAPMPLPTSPLTKVALLLPLSGANADLGQAMLKAAQLAVFDVSGKNFTLLPRDTQGSPEGAARAAQDALNAGAQIIIGPLFATQIGAVKAVALSAHVPVLALSTDTAQAGPDVYVLGLTPAPQVERVVRYAAAHGVTRYAALVPDNALGDLVGAAFREAVASTGGVVAGYEKFDPVTRGIAAPLTRLAGSAGAVEALFLPEDAETLKGFAPQLAQAGWDAQRVHWLGTGLWDVPQSGATASFLVNGWYAASDPAGRTAFVKNYTADYGQAPPRLATLAYDATALTAVLARQDVGYSVSALTNPNGFAGLDGIFRLSPQGGIERGLAVLQVGPEGNLVVDPAPVSFAPAP